MADVVRMMLTGAGCWLAQCFAEFRDGFKAAIGRPALRPNAAEQLVRFSFDLDLALRSLAAAGRPYEAPRAQPSLLVEPGNGADDVPPWGTRG